uniref:ATP synthase F0 subunit 6 n=1 Tax=Mactra antiquata TaxID=2302425 RepID=V9I3M5_9BIVA|nr:ATP synthase F0 subunit 6 [Mactra antiquata]AGH15583.1 ATP synthase F0 subunit 6 [Mactra antiquata]AGH15595.1 ATP synthase F0 subunit 6 [Mactra antiquata]AKJ86565.1 ATP synthase F0 subunit 6 [Mactra antiquata]AKJ86581.1 ATP synthase F0 subunit 6 [Mactra antiquata]
MGFDLLSTFDYNWSGSNGLLNAFVWCSGLTLPLFIYSMDRYWVSCDREHGALKIFTMNVETGLIQGRNILRFGGGMQLTLCLFFILLSICFASLMPFTYPLANHILITASLSFPFWSSTVILFFSTNWRLFLNKFIVEGSWGSTLFYQVLEFFTIMLRGLTLCLRMSMNVSVSLIFAKVFFSFTEAIFIMNLSSLWYIPVVFLAGFYYLAEWFLMFIQCYLFVVLFVSYVNESVIDSKDEVEVYYPWE